MLERKVAKAHQDSIRKLLQKIQMGTLTIDDAMERLRHLPFEDIEYARVDHHRSLRNGYPEVIYCAGKTIDQIQGISNSILANGSNLLATWADDKIFDSIRIIDDRAVYHRLARLVVVEQNKPITIAGKILIVCAGTSDIPVAEEAAITAESFGNQIERLYDVGVAGIHRLLSSINLFYEANVIIVVAGMEGALASVVGGMIDKPIIAVPTSVGYGASFGGIAALLAMLNSCANGIGVVNIDNGFGAGYLASQINRQICLATK